MSVRSPKCAEHHCGRGAELLVSGVGYCAQHAATWLAKQIDRLTRDLDEARAEAEAEVKRLRKISAEMAEALEEHRTYGGALEARNKLLNQELDEARAEAERLRTLAGQLFYRLETPEYERGAWPDGLYDAGCDAWEQTRPAPAGEEERDAR